jgi:hypothetical protein
MLLLSYFSASKRRKENGILPPGSEVNRLYNKRGHL